jgi:hypothetical protein
LSDNRGVELAQEDKENRREPGKDRAVMRLYGRDASGRYYEVNRGIYGGQPRERPRGIPAKPVIKLLLVLAVIVVIASLL